MSSNNSPEDVVAAIKEEQRSLARKLTSDINNLKIYVKVCLEDIEFRRRTAECAEVWSAISQAFCAGTRDLTNFSPTQFDTLETLLRLAQFLYAGVTPTAEYNEELSTNRSNTMHAIVFVLSQLHSERPEDSLRLRIKCLRALANFATIANEAQISHLWQHILQDTGAFDKFVDNWHSEYLHPILHIFVRCQAEMKNWTQIMFKGGHSIPLQLLHRILEDMDNYVDDEETPIFDLVVQFLRSSWQTVTFLEIWDALKQAEIDYRRTQVLAHFMLVKCADGLINTYGTGELPGLTLASLNSALHYTTAKYLRPLFDNPDSFMMAEAENIVSMVRLIFDMFQTFLSDDNPYTSPSVLHDLTKNLIDILKLLYDHIPRKALNAEPSRFAPMPEPISELCKGMKRDIVELLTLLLHKEKTIQDTLRENGGVQLILSLSNIDEDNPYIKERVTLCIRALMEGNEQNQALIREMRPIS